MLQHILNTIFQTLTALKDSVVDLGGFSQSHSLLHQGRNSIFVPVHTDKLKSLHWGKYYILYLQSNI